MPRFGYRIELSEIEAVLLDLPQIAQAAVITFEPEPGLTELVAYYAFKQGVDLPRDEISRALRAKLPPYTGSTSQAIFARHAAGQVLPLATVRPEVPPELERIVLRALAKAPANRFPSAGAFEAALA